MKKWCASAFLVVYGKDIFCAIEVKNKTRIQSKMLKGLVAFKEDYPEAQACLLYRGKERFKIKDIWCMPCEEFLMNLKPDKKIVCSKE